MKALTVIDLFCGAGGFSEGFRQAGFKVIWGVDIWQPAVNTHNGNHTEGNAIQGDVEAISLLPDDEFNKIVPDSEVIIGSPPCVAFSGSNKSGKGDKTLGVRLLKSFFRIVARKKYKKDSILKYWLLENVPRSQEYIQKIYNAKELGLDGNFRLQVKYPNSGEYIAQNFGVPSKRKRFFCGEFIAPEMCAGINSAIVTVGDILGALGEPRKATDKVVNDPNYDFCMRSETITDHHYIKELAEFEWKKAKRLKRDKGYMGKMSFPERNDLPARTVMATMSFSSRESMILAYKKNRYRAPTIREIASFMSFPIDYRFYGKSISMKYKLVGNAVPPKLAYAFAKQIAFKEEKKLPKKYESIKHDDNIDFLDLHGNTFHLNIEKDKKANARFKYHIPYFIEKTFRVELTNHHSDFSSGEFSWDVEIHKSQGEKARVLIPKNKDAIRLLKAKERKSILSFIRRIKFLLTSENQFQKIHCMTSKEIRENGLLGPYELLDKVKKFLDAQSYEDGFLKFKGVKDPIPYKIGVGYILLAEIVKKIKQINKK